VHSLYPGSAGRACRTDALVVIADLLDLAVNNPRAPPPRLPLPCCRRAAESPRTTTYFSCAQRRPKQPVVRGQALAGVACRRRQKKYESPQSTPVAAAQPHASGPSPTERWAMSAEARSMAKPA
jgi:hypothetical protein